MNSSKSCWLSRLKKSYSNCNFLPLPHFNSVHSNSIKKFLISIDGHWISILEWFFWWNSKSFAIENEKLIIFLKLHSLNSNKIFLWIELIVFFYEPFDSIYVKLKLCCEILFLIQYFNLEMFHFNYIIKVIKTLNKQIQDPFETFSN